MPMDRILYYPYINIPNNLWTSRALLYWDNIGVIVPENYIDNPEILEPYMRSLVSAQLVEQIIPRVFTENLHGFKKGFLDIILSPSLHVNSRRKDFEKNTQLKIHVEKFDSGLMQILEDLGLARRENWPWWSVEEKTAKLLMLYLASIISVLDNRSPLTDTVEPKPTRSFSIEGNLDVNSKLRNRLLNDVLPLPTKIKVRDLERIKAKYAKELSRFRNNIETIILDLAQFKEGDNFEERYNLQIKEIEDDKAFIADKLSEPKFGKIVFGTLCSLTATGIAVSQTSPSQLYWTIPSILTAVYTAIESHKRSGLIEQHPLRYLALIDRQLKIEN